MGKHDRELDSILRNINSITSTTPSNATTSTTLNNSSNSNNFRSNGPVPIFNFFKVANRSINATRNIKIDQGSIFPTLPKKRAQVSLSSYSNLKKNDSFKSDEFTLGDNMWQLLFVPSTTLNKQPYLSIYLISTTSLKQPSKPIKVDFSLELFNFQKAITHIKCRSFEFTKNQTYTGFLDYINQNELEVSQYYQEYPQQQTYYFTIIITIDTVLEQQHILEESTTSKELLNYYQNINEMVLVSKHIDYFRSLILSLYFIPLIRDEILRLDFNSPTKMHYQIQRLFFYIFKNKKLLKDDGDRFYKSILYFIKSNQLSFFDYPKILEQLLIEILENSTNSLGIKSLFPSIDQLSYIGGGSGGVISKKYVYNSMFEDDVNNNSELKLDNEFQGRSSDKVIEYDSSDGIVFQISNTNGGCSKEQFVNLLIGSNQKTLSPSSKSKLPSILHVSLSNRAQPLNEDSENDVTNIEDDLLKKYSNFQYPEEIQIRSNDYIVYSVWAFENPENNNIIIDSNGVNVTYIREVVNSNFTSRWIKIKPTTVEPVSSFEQVLQQTCGIENDRLLFNHSTFDLPRDITFSYMVVYVAKSKINELFSSSNSPLPTWEDFNIQDTRFKGSSSPTFAFNNNKKLATVSPIIESQQPQQPSPIFIPTAIAITSNSPTLPPISPTTATPLTSTNNTIFTTTIDPTEREMELNKALARIGFLEEKNKQLLGYKEKSDQLENLSIGKNQLFNQLEDEISRVEKLENQLLTMGNQFKRLLFDEQEKWKNEKSILLMERDRLSKEIQDLQFNHNRLLRENDRNTKLMDGLIQDKKSLLTDKEELIKQKKLGIASTGNEEHSRKYNAIEDSHPERLDKLSLEELLTFQKALSQALINTTEKINDRHDCVICCATFRDTLILPCNHFVSCFECVKNLSQCPMCRVKITGRAQIISS